VIISKQFDVNIFWNEDYRKISEPAAGGAADSATARQADRRNSSDRVFVHAHRAIPPLLINKKADEVPEPMRILLPRKNECKEFINFLNKIFAHTSNPVRATPDVRLNFCAVSCAAGSVVRFAGCADVFFQQGSNEIQSAQFQMPKFIVKRKHRAAPDDFCHSACHACNLH
jgi:hypothetical protein